MTVCIFSLQDEICMHLTNYAINKLSKDFIRDDDSGSKRRVTTVNKWFIENGYDIDKIWAAINVSDTEHLILHTVTVFFPQRMWSLRR